MNCEEARERVVVGAGLLRGRRARAHVRQCPDCAVWLAGVRETERLLEALPSHPMPSALEQRLRDVPQARDMRRAGQRKGISMKKLVVGVVCVAVVAGIAFAGFFVQSSRGGGVAWAEIVNALRNVNTVHMVGETFGKENNTLAPLSTHKDKWIRREPFAVYEAVSPVNPKTPEQATLRYIFAGNNEKVYWYFPDRGNRAWIAKGLSTSFMDDVLAPLALTAPAGSEPRFKVTGKSQVDGRKVILVEVSGGQMRTVAAVDAETKLTLRVTQFAPGAGGKEIEATRLRFEYNGTPPQGIFDWTPPAGATVVDRR